LDEWDELAKNEPYRDWLRAVLAAAESEDALSRQVRVARAEKDNAKRRTALEQLAASVDVAKVPARALTRFAQRLDAAARATLLRRAQAQYPADFWVIHNLARAHEAATPPQRDEALRFLTVAVALRPDSPGTHYNLGNALRDKGQLDDAIACYRKAIELDPKYGQAHTNLGNILKGQGDIDEAIACYRQAIAADPELIQAHINLGDALRTQGDLAEAVTSLRRAAQLNPNDAKVHSNVAEILRAHGDLSGAIACYRQAIAADPKYALAHYNLGNILRDQGNLAEAIACYREAIAAEPKYVRAYNNLGALLNAHLSDHQGAAACFRKALELDPTRATYHDNLGIALANQGEWKEAIACFRKAIELDPKAAIAHCNLGRALQSQGEFAAALAALGTGHELGSKRKDWTYPSEQWVQEAKKLVELEPHLSDVLSGKQSPTDGAEHLGFAKLCYYKRLYSQAVRLYSEVFTADAKLTDDLKAGNRYIAACCAALAGCGQGDDADKLDEAERASLRRKALQWLQANLAQWAQQLETGQTLDRTRVQRAMRGRQSEPNFSGVRDAAALAKLPADERAAWQKLWAESEMLLQKALDMMR
jgi:tetratricopeptide (TPR) repeat protein